MEQKPTDVEVESSATPTEVKEEPVSSEQEVVETKETPEASQPSFEAVDEQGVPWKNRFMEAQRKLQEMPQTIERTIEETLARKQQAQPTEPTYTIAQLETFKLQNQDRPDLIAWAEEQKSKIMESNLQKGFDQRLQAIKKDESEKLTRQQSEQWVVNHPKFKECFTTDPIGNKVWNMANPLTQIMSGYLSQNDPVTGRKLSDRPDGLAVAARLAYGDYALMNEGRNQKTVSKLKSDLKETQKKTLTSGGGVANPSSQRDELSSAKEELAKTGNAKNAVRAYLKKYHGVE